MGVERLACKGSSKVAEFEIPIVIVAGGQGTRMRPLTERVPKALLPLRGATVLDRQLDWLHAQGARRVVACLGHLARPIESHLAAATTSRGFDIAISREGEAALGTAGAVRLAAERGFLGDQFLTLYGDTIPTVNLAAVRDFWHSSGASAVLCVYPTAYGGREARAEVRNDRVVRFARHPSTVEAARMMHGDYGIAGFHASQFAHLSLGVRSGFGTIHADLARRGSLAAYDVGRPPNEVGTMDGYRRAQLSLTDSESSADNMDNSNR